MACLIIGYKEEVEGKFIRVVGRVMTLFYLLLSGEGVTEWRERDKSVGSRIFYSERPGVVAQKIKPINNHHHAEWQRPDCRVLILFE